MKDKSEHYLSRLETVNAETLTPMVQDLLRDPTLIVTDWKYERLSGGAGGGAGPSHIYRFSGHCTGQNGMQSWSLVLKIILSRNEEAPSDPKYWKREYELYRNGLLDDLPLGISTPRGYGVEDYPDESVWIWMEEVKDYLEAPWAEAQYARIGRHLGQFNGAYLAGTPIPSANWLSIDWLRKSLTELEKEYFPSLQAALSHPLVKDYFPSDAVKEFSRLRDDVEMFLDVLDRLPQTFTHQDGMDRNLLMRHIANDEYETVAIDWAFAGQAAIGMDAAMPIIVNILVGDLDPSKAEALDTLIFEGYVQGMRDAGWDDREDQVRLGYTISTALKHLEIMGPTIRLADKRNHSWVEKAWGKPAAHWLHQQAGMHIFAHKLADEARALI